MTVYHITDKENINSILTEGLLPMCGENSRLVSDYSHAIYLCDFNSIKYWSILLCRNSIIKITISDAIIEKAIQTNYGDYNEIIL